MWDWVEHLIKDLNRSRESEAGEFLSVMSGTVK